MNNYVRIYAYIGSYILKLIFGLVHPSTFERLKTQFVFVSSFKRSKVEECTISLTQL